MTTHSDRILLSKKGMKELQKRIANLERQQKDAQARLRDLDRGNAREERLARAEALSELESIADQLSEQRDIQRNARPLPSKRARLKVAIGSVVDIIDQQGKLFRYTLVDSIEVNPSDGRISTNSPLGSSLLGKQLQDTVELSIGNQLKSFQLVKIR